MGCKVKIKFDNVEDKIFWNFKERASVPTYNMNETMKAIKERAFAVTGVYAVDKVETIRQGLELAMKEGWSLDTFKSKVTEMLQARGFLPLRDDNKTFRWDVIYRTNIATAYERGRFERMMQIADIYPYRRFVAVEDERTTTTCRELNGAVARYDSDLYLNNQCPRHFNCRSTWVIEENPDLKEVAKWEKKQIVSKEGFGKFDLPNNFLKEAEAKTKKLDNELSGVFKEGKKESNYVKRLELEKKIKDLKNKSVFDLTQEEINVLQEYFGLETKKDFSIKDFKLSRYYDRKLQKEAKKLYSDFVREYLDWYSGEGYVPINAYYRSGRRLYTLWEEQHKRFEKEDWQLVVKGEVNVGRGEIFRRVEDFITRMMQLESGILNTAFTSTTTDRRAMEFFGMPGSRGHISVLFQLRLKKGTRVAVPPNTFESEIIIKQGAKINMLSKKIHITKEKAIIIIIEGEVWTD